MRSPRQGDRCGSWRQVAGPFDRRQLVTAFHDPGDQHDLGPTGKQNDLMGEEARADTNGATCLLNRAHWLSIPGWRVCDGHQMGRPGDHRKVIPTMKTQGYSHQLGSKCQKAPSIIRGAFAPWFVYRHRVCGADPRLA